MSSTSAKTLSQTISERLAEEIISHRFQPGERLDEQSIAARFNVSRSPVRDALQQLTNTKLVEYLPRRGFWVATVDSSELDGLFEASGEIEALCAKLCALRATPSEKKRIEFVHLRAMEAKDKDDAGSYAVLNEEFHTLVHAGAHNRTLYDLAQSLRQRLAPFRSGRFFLAGDRLTRSNDEHNEIVAAIMASDAIAAARAMNEHLANSTVNAQQHMRSSPIQDSELENAA